MRDDPISGGGSMSSSPVGSARPRVVKHLDEAECLRLLGTRGMDRAGPRRGCPKVPSATGL